MDNKFFQKSPELKDYVCFDICEVYTNHAQIIDITQPMTETHKFGVKLPYPKSAFYFVNNITLEKWVWYCCEDKNPINQGIKINALISNGHEYDNLRDTGFLGLTISVNRDYSYTDIRDAAFYDQDKLSQEECEKIANKFDGYARGAFLTSLLLLNCKNFRPQKQEYDIQYNQKRVRKGKEPLNDYYVLKIPSIYRVRAGETLSQYHNRLHSCRGHFKNYKEGAGLYGRLHGAFWWNNQLRGNRNLGEIKKDYKVNV